MTSEKKRLLICGGGHASLPALKMGREWLSRGLEVVLVTAHPYLYYSGAVPQFLGGFFEETEARINLEKLCHNYGTYFKCDLLTEVDPVAQSVKLCSGEQLSWDYLFINTGVRSRNSSFSHPRYFPVKPMQRLVQLKDVLHTQRKQKILILGGGAAGCEIALNLKASQNRSNPDLTLFEGGDILLSSFSGRLSEKVTAALNQKGVRVICNRLTSEKELSELLKTFDIIIDATGNMPETQTINHGLPADQTGRIRVNALLQSVAHPRIFAAGDCAFVGASGYDPVGVHAVKQGALFRDVMDATLRGSALPVYKPWPATPLILSQGQNRGFFVSGNLVFSGKWCIILKYMLDMNWLEKYTFPRAERRSWLRLAYDAITRTKKAEPRQS